MSLLDCHFIQFIYYITTAQYLLHMYIYVWEEQTYSFLISFFLTAASRPASVTKMMRMGEMGPDVLLLWERTHCTHNSTGWTNNISFTFPSCIWGIATVGPSVRSHFCCVVYTSDIKCEGYNHHILCSSSTSSTSSENHLFIDVLHHCSNAFYFQYTIGRLASFISLFVLMHESNIFPLLFISHWEFIYLCRQASSAAYARWWWSPSFSKGP